jgi:hypothetical protein
MSITITTGGITMTGGGVSFTAPPPSTPTAGWYAGGQPGSGIVSTVDRITFATDTTTASVRGPLNGSRYFQGATGNLNYGWYAGGGPSPQDIDLVSRITYATDTATASSRGPLSYSTYMLTATGTDTAGWFAGGSSSSGGYTFSTVSRITFATDTATASTRGPLPFVYGVNQLASTTDSTTYGWFGGGFDADLGNTSKVSRITYATDTTTASSKGPLSVARIKLAATGTNSYGWYAGGSAPYYSRVDRIDYANDTATASVRGPLSLARFGLAASTDSTTYGWFGGGYTGVAPGYKSLVDRITYETDTATATARGPLSRNIYLLAATSGVQ